MELLKPIFTTYLFDVEIVTPVHVGMAQEKNYVRGLDYVLEDGEAWIVSIDKLLPFLSKPTYSKELQNLTLAMESGNSDKAEKTLKKLLDDHPEIQIQKLPIQGAPSDGIIRRMYRTGLGQYAIPGTSLKGAIRSVLLAELKKLPGSNLRNDESVKLMGDIGNNLMRFVQVGDLAISKQSIEVRRTKIFSADGDPKAGYNAPEAKQARGEWKDSGRHNKLFKADSFITYYELTVPSTALHETTGTLRILIGNSLPHQLGEHVTGVSIVDGMPKSNIPNYNYLLANKPQNWLVDTIRAHTHQYLTREKAYFTKFENKNLDDLKPIQDRLDDLIKQNKELNSCLLRVGAGVGFHSITGDWQEQSQDHITQWNQAKDYLKNKTRKFAFEEIDEGVDFALMGFIKLTLQTPESKAARDQKRFLDKEKAIETARLAAEAEAQRLETERIKAEEARKPKLFEGTMKQGQELDAEVIISARMNKVKVYAAGYEPNLFDLIGYLNPLPIGTVVIVKADQLNGKKQLLQIRYLKPKT